MNTVIHICVNTPSNLCVNMASDTCMNGAFNMYLNTTFSVRVNAPSNACMNATPSHRKLIPYPYGEWGQGQGPIKEPMEPGSPPTHRTDTGSICYEMA